MSEAATTKHQSRMPATRERVKETPVYSPRVDIRETDAEVTLLADMPGVDENSVSVDLDGSELSIRGTFVPTTPDGYSLTYEEYGTGDYERTFTLGDTIDRGGIKATVRDGVLHLVLTKVKEAQPRRIAVNAG